MKDFTCQGHSFNTYCSKCWLKFIDILQALHHPFTAPHPADMKDLSSARALAYDMVYNGVEVYVFIQIYLQ